MPPREIGVTLSSMRTNVGLLVALLMLGSACTDKTSLLVEVVSPDLAVPADVDTLVFEASTPDGWRVSETFAIDGPWPHTLAILPGPANTSSEVLVSVTGLTAGDFAVRRTARTRFSSGGTQRVVLQLTRECLGVECDPGIDCISGMCTDVIVPDAGVDSGPPTDSAAPMDSGTPPMDSGTPPMDSGTPPMDSGTPPMDSGMPPMDSGMPPMDSGADACVSMGPEVCGGGDEDCDMSVDEGLPCPGNLVISELATDGPTGGTDEFIEIYNRTDTAIDGSGLEVEYQSSAGTTWGNRAVLPAGATIPARGFYLVGSGGYSRPVATDPGGGWTSGMNRLGGHIRLWNGVDELDRLGWGTAMNAEGAPAPVLTDAATHTFERKAVSTSTAASMETGADSSRGNGHDTDDNSADVVERTSAGPQNTTSPPEMP